MIDAIARIWNSMRHKDDGTPVVPKDPPHVPDDGWKHQRTMDHEKLVEEHLRQKAFLIAEKDGFRKDPAEYWEEAKRV